MDSLERPPGEAEPCDPILRRRVNLLYEAIPISLFGIVLGAGLTVLLISRATAGPLELAWLGAALLTSAARFAGYRHFHRGTGAARPERERLRWAVAGVLASGLVWGAASPILYQASDPSSQVILAFVIAGITAGAVNTLSVFLWVANVFVALVLTPLVVRLAVDTGPAGPGVAVMCLAYWGLLIVTARRFHRTILDGLEMGFAREQAEADLERQAFYDPLTGLPNRRLLLEHLRQDLAWAHRHGHLGALAYLDIDQFKTINESLGHQAGDALLKSVAERLRKELGETDSAARLGGDEFVVLLAELASNPVDAAHRARQSAEQIRLALAAPYQVDGHELHISVSLGLALYPADGDDPDALLRAADTAMYRAKEQGRDTIRFFLPEMQRAAVARMELETALRSAIADGALELYFQPQVDRQGRLVGAEALARWPDAGLLDASPERFVPLAEDTGLIHAFGDWVLDQACAAMSRIRQVPGGEQIRCLAINVSPRQFRRREFAEHLEFLLEHHGLAGQDIELEITERTLITDVEDTTTKIQRLRRRGLRFAIDDFGTGYSSLAYLKSLPVDALKIDQSFVRDALHDPSDQAIVLAIVNLAVHLGLDVIAEGVDSAQVHRFLVDQGCGQFQGYHFHRPMPLDDLVKLISRPETAIA